MRATPSEMTRIRRCIDFDNDGTKYRVIVTFDDGAATAIVLFEYEPKKVLERVL